MRGREPRLSGRGGVAMLSSGSMPARPTGRFRHHVTIACIALAVCGLLIACGSTQGSTAPAEVSIASGAVEGVPWELSVYSSGQNQCVKGLVGTGPAPALTRGCGKRSTGYWSGPTAIPIGAPSKGKALLFFFAKDSVKYLHIRLSQAVGSHQWLRVPVEMLSSEETEAAHFPGPTAYGYVIAANALQEDSSVCIQRVVVVGRSGATLERSPRVICQR